MTAEGLKRKLAAILSADAESYSRLMADDEESTIRTLTVYRSAMTDLIQQHRGRVVDAPGDNLLADFTSAMDAGPSISQQPIQKTRARGGGARGIDSRPAFRSHRRRRKSAVLRWRAKYPCAIDLKPVS